MNLFLKNGKISEEVMFWSHFFLEKNRWISKKDRYGHMFATQTCHDAPAIAALHAPHPPSANEPCSTQERHPAKVTAGTWKSPVWKGKSYSKPSFLGYMLLFGYSRRLAFLDDIPSYFLVLPILMVFHFIFMVKKKCQPPDLRKRNKVSITIYHMYKYKYKYKYKDKDKDKDKYKYKLIHHTKIINWVVWVLTSLKLNSRPLSNHSLKARNSFTGDSLSCNVMRLSVAGQRLKNNTTSNSMIQSFEKICHNSFAIPQGG